MSTIVISNIVGSGAFAVPTDDAELTASTAAIQARMATVAGLVYERCQAIVDSSQAGAGSRVLNAIVDGFTYGGVVVPSTAQTAALTAAIRAALLSSVTSLGSIDVSLHQNVNQYFHSQSGLVLSPVSPYRNVGISGAVATVIPIADPLPAAWTTLNLSASVFSGKTGRVFLYSKSSLADAHDMAIREPGDTNEYYATGTGRPSLQYTGTISAANRSTLLSCRVNSSNQIQYRGNGSSVTCNYSFFMLS